MSSIVVTKDERGRLVGAGEKHQRAYAKFRKTLEQLTAGELFTISAWFPRSGKFHRMHFAMLAAIYDAQEQFEDVEQLRMWAEVGAGHCTFVPGPTGRMVAIPKSIAYDKLDDAEFADHHEAVKRFLRSARAQSFLWPHLSPEDAGSMVEAILEEFTR